MGEVPCQWKTVSIASCGPYLQSPTPFSPPNMSLLCLSARSVRSTCQSPHVSRTLLVGVPCQVAKQVRDRARAPAVGFVCTFMQHNKH